MRNWIRFFWLGVFLVSAQARGASFDCAKAVSSTEKAICASERISKLDSDLGKAYRAAVETSKDPAALAAAQRAWIKERNKCQDEACLVAAYEQRIAALDPASAPAKRGADDTAAPAAASPAAQPAPTTAAAEQPDDGRDLVVFFARGTALTLVAGIDGSKRMANPATLLRSGYRICVVVRHPYSQKPADMLDLPEGDFLSLGRDRIRPVIDQAAGGTVSQVAVSSTCAASGTLGHPYPEVLAVPRDLLSSLKGTAFLAYDIQGKYDPALVVRRSAIVQAGEQLSALRQQAAVADQQRYQRLDALAAADSRDHVASVSLASPTPNDRSLRFCSLAYSGASGAAMLGYAHRGTEWLSPDSRARVEALGAKPTGRSPFHNSFASLDELYQKYQQKSADCHVYVDFPKNLKLLVAAVERDQGGRKLELNEIAAAQGLRESWARHNGFADWSASEFAESINASSEQLKALAAHAIGTKAAVAAALDEMKAAGYSNSSAVADLVSYLADKKSAAKGQSAVGVKQERERAAQVAAAQAQAQARAREAEYAKQYPYTATLSCGMGGRHLSIVACFTGNVGTQLEVRNGNDYKMLQAWEISQAYSQSPEGLVIPLREDFQIKAQNSDGTLLLSLRVKENSTGRIVYQKSASQFGVVNVRSN